MPKRCRATRPLYTVSRAAWPIITARRRADTRGRESSVSTIPELNRTLRSTIWISRARDAPVQPGTPAASRPGRRKAPRAILLTRVIQLSRATPGFPARPRSRRTPRSARTPRSVKTPRYRRAEGLPGRCLAGCAGTLLRLRLLLRGMARREPVRSGLPGPAHRGCWGPVPARSGSSVPAPALIRSSRLAPDPSRRFLLAPDPRRPFLLAPDPVRPFLLAPRPSRPFLPVPEPSRRGRA
jgi:hypothetical protein